MKNDSDCKISKNTSCSKKNFVAGKNLPYVLATFVHISNIPAATDPILANFLSICILMKFNHMAGYSHPQNFFAEGCLFADFAIAVIFYPVIKTYIHIALFSYTF